MSPSNIKGHHNHFHVYLKVPKPLEIGGAKKLTLDSASASGSTFKDAGTNLSPQEQLEALKIYANSVISPKEQMMFELDNVHNYVVEATQAQAVKSQSIESSSGKNKFNYIILNCQQIENREGADPRSADRVLDPAIYVRIMGNTNENPIDEAHLDPILLTAPKHGKLKKIRANNGYGYYSYNPEPGFRGRDLVEFSVEANGKIYKVILNLVIVNIADDSENQKVCPTIKMKKVAFLNSWEPLSSVSVQLGKVDEKSLGETFGTGTGAQITLDTNAAGHGWFIDSTPDQNDEFLPTSNPDVWIAKAGSAADGKMDMLSVLLHEYGHALGIEHSGDDGDFMAASLQSLERRLPRAEELGLVSLYRLRRADYGWTLDAGHTRWV
ncbi:matrixin family metalloprotease [Undibacterium sp. CY7W]|uniref:Matrixin family metalloprotease n=1 Tax=Undibacterium rugosum TaxID=2762291 RepID=A0A923I0A9_9BURK|nr:matrixin family metalloprotease [Undibacterium rugosum]MBC3935296.1 matrixin family metalloprotease [Undibacterium rugosum]